MLFSRTGVLETIADCWLFRVIQPQHYLFTERSTIEPKKKGIIQNNTNSSCKVWLVNDGHIGSWSCYDTQTNEHLSKHNEYTSFNTCFIKLDTHTSSEIYALYDVSCLLRDS